MSIYVLSKSTSLAGFSRLCGYTFYRLSVHWHDSPTAIQYSRKSKSRTMTTSLLEAHPRSDDTISVGVSRKLRFKQCHQVPWSWRKVTLHHTPGPVCPHSASACSITRCLRCYRILDNLFSNLGLVPGIWSSPYLPRWTFRVSCCTVSHGQKKTGNDRYYTKVHRIMYSVSLRRVVAGF